MPRQLHLVFEFVKYFIVSIFLTNKVCTGVMSRDPNKPMLKMTKTTINGVLQKYAYGWKTDLVIEEKNKQ